MKKEHLYLESTDAGKRIHVICWLPEGEPVKILQIVHGMVEYVDRYDNFAQFLCEKGFAVVGHDHPGHGFSAVDDTTFDNLPGCELGYYGDGDGKATVLANMWTVTQYAQQRFSDAPLYIMGHSMGSFYTRRYITLYGDALAGAIIMGTGFLPAWLLRMGVMLGNIVVALRGRHYRSKLLYSLSNGAYQKVFKDEGHNAWLSANRDNVARYNADPLCSVGFTCSAYRDFFRCMVEVATWKDIDFLPSNMPILIISGCDDPVGGSEAVEKLARGLAKRNKENITTKTYVGMRHEILNEIDRYQVYNDILNWLNK